MFIGLILEVKIFPIITSGTTTLLTSYCPTTNSKVDLLAPITLTFALGAFSLSPQLTPP